MGYKTKRYRLINRLWEKVEFAKNKQTKTNKNVNMLKNYPFQRIRNRIGQCYPLKLI